jgi:Ca2+-transporting ATPase
MGPSGEDIPLALAMAFTVLALAQVFHVAAIHGGEASFIQAPLLKNKLLLFAVLATTALQLLAIYEPFAQSILDTVALDGIELAMAFALGASVFVAVEVEKYWRRRRRRAGFAASGR